MTISVSQSDGARWVQDKSPRSILTLKPKHGESWCQEVCVLASSCGARGSFRFKHFTVIPVYMTLTSTYTPCSVTPTSIKDTTLSTNSKETPSILFCNHKFSSLILGNVLRIHF